MLRLNNGKRRLRHKNATKIPRMLVFCIEIMSLLECLPFFKSVVISGIVVGLLRLVQVEKITYIIILT